MGPVQVLYLETRAGAGRAAARRLQARGFLVRNVRGVPEEIRTSPPDVVVWDLEALGSSELSTLSQFRGACPNAPVLVLGPKGADPADARELIGLGVHSVLTKPVKTADLELAIHAALEHGRSPARGRDLERVEYANRQLAALNEVSNHFCRIRDEDELLETVPRLLTESLDFDRGTVLLHSGRGLSVRSVCFPKDPPGFAERFVARVQSGELPIPRPLLDSFENDETCFVADPNTDPRWPKAPGEVIRTRSIVVSPIRSQGKPIGVLIGNMQHHERAMDPQDVARFEMFANMVGLALDNIRAYHGLERIVSERTESLREANRELQAILDSSLAAIALVDSQGKILGVNRRVAEFFGVQAGDIVHGPVQRLHERVRSLAFDPKHFDRVIEAQQAASGTPPEQDALEHYESAIRIAGAPSRDLIVTSVAVRTRDDREPGRVWIYTDVTKLKEADEQLHLIIDAAPIPLLVSRLSDGKILYTNDREAALMGLSREELLGRRSLDFYADPDERPQLMKRLLAAGRLDDVEVRLRRADGELQWSVFSMVKTELRGEPVIVAGSYDVTRRKQAEDALEQERNFVSAVLDTAGALVVVLDAEGRVVRFNRACERISGYTFEEVRGRPFPETFLAPEERSEVERDFARLLSGLPRLERRNCWLTKSGERRLIEWSNTTLPGPDGRVEYVVATGIDVTERHRAVQKLKLYRQIYDNSYDGIVVFDADGRFVERNPIHRVLSGYADDELTGRSAAELFGSDVVENVVRTVREAGSYRAEVLARRADGDQVPVEVSIFSIPNEAGGVLYYVAIGRDIAERKKAETELRRAHDELEERVRARTEELARLNETLLNEVAERKLAAEALRRSHDLLSRQNAVLAEFSKRLSPDRGNLRSLLGELTRGAASTLGVARVGIWMYQEAASAIECLDLYDEASGRHQTGQRLSEFDYPAYFRALGEHRAIAAHDAHRDPRTREFSETYLAPLGISSMLDAPIWLEGRMVGVVCHEHVGPPRTWTPEEERFAASVADFVSLTLEAHQRFRAEQALRAAHDELEARVEERTAELRHAQAQLVQSEKMASLGMLVAGIAHEINTPVGAIRSMHDTLVRSLQKLETTLTEEHPEVVTSSPTLQSTLAMVRDANRVIENGATRVTGIVRRLRSFARLDEAERKEVDIHEGLEDTLALIHHELKHGIVVRREYGQIPPLVCYPGRLNQVFLNLLNNARQAMNGKGEIVIRTFVRDDRAHIEIRDTGSGISPEHLGRIFDPGFTTKGVGVGTGLGLAICYQIVRDHKGEIQVESEPGRGATFTVVLPLRPDEDALPLTGSPLAFASPPSSPSP